MNAEEDLRRGGTVMPKRLITTTFDGFEDGCLLFRWDSKQAPENVKSFMTGYLDRFGVGALLKKDQSINQGSQKSNNEKQ
jgi:hypothetical protein